jgi:NAD(P) transhydrogenase subunit beta
MLFLLHLGNLIAAFLFILALHFLASPHTARQGNICGQIAMALAVTAIIPTLHNPNVFLILITVLLGGLVGIYSAFKVKITALPQMIAAFNGLGGLAAVCIALTESLSVSATPSGSLIGAVIGALAFTGSAVAFAKLQGVLPTRPLNFRGQHLINALLFLGIITLTVLYSTKPLVLTFVTLTLLSLILGFTLILPIGGADMPIAISLLNAYSGFATVGIGLSLGNLLLIIVGTLVGTAGTVLTRIMLKAMNRSLWDILAGRTVAAQQSTAQNNTTAHSASPEDAAFIMENANKIIIVPGYGMAVAQAQHALKTMAEILRNKYAVEVKFAIHPVAGRMPGHMNVLLAEANIDYNDIYELSEINNEFATADVAYVIGANDITNPLAKTDTSSPLYGMPILEVEKAKTVLVVKRSLGSGYSGVDNPLFFAPNTLMLYGDAKAVTSQIVNALEN